MQTENYISIPESRLLRFESQIMELLEIMRRKPEPVSNFPKPKATYTRNEFCAHFNISISTLNRMVKDGKIKVSKLGLRKVCIPASDVKRLEEEGMN